MVRNQDGQCSFGKSSKPNFAVTNYRSPPFVMANSQLSGTTGLFGEF
jgi:hypothetical protein